MAKFPQASSENVNSALLHLFQILLLMAKSSSANQSSGPVKAVKEKEKGNQRGTKMEWRGQMTTNPSRKTRRKLLKR